MALEPAGLRWVNENLPSFIDGVRRANRAMADSGDAADRTGGGFSVLSGVIMGVASAATTFALDAAVKMGQALIGLGTSSIGVAAEFESMVVQMENAAGAAVGEAEALGGLDEMALKVGADTRLMGVSATGAAGAMTGLLRTGLSLEEVMGDVGGYMEEDAQLGGALRASIDLAAASQLDMVQASDLAVIAMSTFGLNADEITGAMDHMVRSANASVAEVDTMSESFRYGAPAARDFGMDIEDFNTALAVLSQGGYQGSIAGTTLSAVFRDLKKTTPKATKAMNKLGISIYDAATGETLPFIDILAQLEIALGDMTDAEKDAAMGAIFQAQGMRGINVLLEQGVEGWVEMTDQIGEATSMTALAEARSQTYAGQMEAMQGVIETLKIRIGTALLPVLTDLMGVFSELVDRYGPLLTSIFEQIGATLSNVMQVALPLLEEFMTALEGGWPAVSALLMEWASEFWSWLTGPGGVISTASGMVQRAVSAIADWFVANWPTIQAKLLEWASKFWDWATSAAGQAGVGLGGLISVISEWLETNWPTIQAKLLEWAATFWDWVTEEVIPSAKKEFKKIGMAIRDWAESSEGQGILEKVGESLGKALIAGIGIALKSTVELGTIFADTAPDLIDAALTGWIPAIDAIVEGLVGGLIEGITSSLGIDLSPKLNEALVNLVSLIIFPWDMIFEAGKGGDAAVAGIQSVLTEAATRAGEAFVGIRDALSTAFQEALIGIGEKLAPIQNALQVAFQNIAGFINETLVPAFQAIVDFLSARITAAIEIARSVWNIFLTTLSAVQSWIQENIIPVFEAIGHVLTAVVNLALTAAAGLWQNVLYPALEKVWNFILENILPVFESIANIIMTVVGAAILYLMGQWDELKSALEKVWSFISENILPMFQSVKEGAEETAGEGVSFLTQLWEKLREKLETVWSFISENILPIFEEVASVVKETLGEALIWLKDTIITPLSEALQSIEDVLSGVTTKLETLASSIGDITLPEWLTPGSMTPFEEGLRGIGTAITEEVAPAFSTFLTMLMSRWSEFGFFLTTESWPLLREDWTLLTMEMEILWREAIDLMEQRFETFLTTVLTGIQRMIQAWNKLKAAILAVAAAVIDLYTQVLALTSDEVIKKLDRVAEAFNDIKSAAKAAAKACKAAANACGGIGGDAPPPTGPGLQMGGMFQVPAAVGPQGMLIRVHPRELVTVIPARQVVGGLGGREANVTIGPNYISEEFDFAVFEDRVKRVVTDAIET